MFSNPTILLVILQMCSNRNIVTLVQVLPTIKITLCPRDKKSVGEKTIPHKMVQLSHKIKKIQLLNIFNNILYDFTDIFHERGCKIY